MKSRRCDEEQVCELSAYTVLLAERGLSEANPRVEQPTRMVV